MEALVVGDKAPVAGGDEDGLGELGAARSRRGVKSMHAD